MRRPCWRGYTSYWRTSAPWDWIDVADDRFDLRSEFDGVISANDINGPGRLEPDIYERGAAELGVAPKNGWTVEDSTATRRTSRWFMRPRTAPRHYANCS